MPTSNSLFDASSFWRSWLKGVCSETSTGGRNSTPHIVPTLDPDFGNDGNESFRQPAAMWGDVVAVNLWALYQTTGDKRMLEEQCLGAQVWIESGIPRNEAGPWTRSTFYYANWLDPLESDNSQTPCC